MSKRRLSIASSSASQNGETPACLNKSSDMAAISVVDLPPLPKISGDLMLQTFTHKSLHFEGAFISEVETNERLAELGNTVLQLVVTNFLYKKLPPLAASEILVSILLERHWSFIDKRPHLGRKGQNTIRRQLRGLGPILPSSR